MYFKIGFLLLGFAFVTYSQTICNCNDLKECLKIKRQDQRKLYDGCEKKCVNKFNLLTNVDVDAIQECLHTKAGEIHRLARDQIECALKPGGGACGVGAARKRRQFIGDAQAPLNTNTNVQIGNQTPTNGALGASGADVDNVIELRPYRDCIQNCIENVQPEISTQEIKGWLRGVQECSISVG